MGVKHGQTRNGATRLPSSGIAAGCVAAGVFQAELGDEAMAMYAEGQRHMAFTLEHLGTSWNYVTTWISRAKWRAKHILAWQKWSKMEGIYMRQWRIILGIFLAIAFYGSIHLVGGILDPFQRRGIEFGILECSRFSGTRGHFSPGGGKGDWQQCLQSIISLYFFIFLSISFGSCWFQPALMPSFGFHRIGSGTLQIDL